MFIGLIFTFYGSECKKYNANFNVNKWLIVFLEIHFLNLCRDDYWAIIISSQELSIDRVNFSPAVNQTR